MHLEPTFGRHQTFTARFGWFKKAHDALSADSSVFSREDATLVLGVGKNMVEAMRFWCGAADLVQPRKLQRGETPQPTELARALFDDSGWDPFLELPATTWLLHWRLFAPGCQLPVWWFAIHDYRHPDFTADTLAEEAVKSMQSLYGFAKIPSANSVRRDAECFIHTYARKPHGKVMEEDAFACPFRTLGLVESVPDRPGTYKLRVGPKPNLPSQIVLHAALEFASRRQTTAQSISLARLLKDPGSPGRVFQLDEDSLLAALRAACTKLEDIQVVDTAGVTALQFTRAADDLALDVVNNLYKRASGTSSRLRTLPGEPELLAAGNSTQTGSARLKDRRR